MRSTFDVASTSNQSRSLSGRLWDLDWSKVLPWTIEDLRVELSTYEEILPFITEHYPAAFGQQGAGSRFLPQPLTPAKRRFGAEMDVFALRAEAKTVAVIMAHPSDWTTYYIRSAAILPAYRNRHYMSAALSNITAAVEAAGVERLEFECAPNNTPMQRMLQRQNYVLTSTTASERWGFVARYTRFLGAGAEAAFTRQFCLVPPQERRAS